MKMQIRSRWDENNVLFECELPDEFEGKDSHKNLGAALIEALKGSANLIGANLIGADLSGADLHGANLSDAYLYDANLIGANLFDADLCGANLSGADLSDANLRGANLFDADLCGANLSGANLRGADLSNANLSGADLSGADLGNTQFADDVFANRAPLFLTGLYYDVMVLDHHIKIGCELHRISEWRDFDNERIARMDGLRSRKFWAAHKAGLLALCESDGRE